eukprot:m.148362 g.148362  ORF g.148362 m.148362 type:complete len:179 (+) comp17311_c0_seq1:428-964(+)
MMGKDEPLVNRIWKSLIWLTDATGARQSSTLVKHNIQHVLDLSGGPLYRLPEQCKRTVVAVDDRCEVDILPVIEQCLPLLDYAVAANQPLLVHCAMGASRSATVVISWLMSRQGWSLLRAMQHCKRRRHVVRPNNGFFATLRALDVEWNGVDSMPLSTQEYMRWHLEWRPPSSSCVVS